MTISLLNTANSPLQASPPASFPATPVEGNQLFAVVSDRNGATSSTIDGTGWTMREEEEVAAGDGTYRHYLAVWEKVAGASEPTTVTATTNSGGSAILVIGQLESDSAETFTFETSASAQTFNAGTITSQTTGTTASTSGAVACLGVCAIKSPGSDIAPWTSWTNSFTNIASYDGGTSVLDVSVSLLNSSATGTKESTASGTGTDRSVGGAILVFALGTAGSGSVTAVAATATAAAPVPVVAAINPVEYISQGAAVAGTTSITTAAYGTGWAEGDLGVCVVASNHTTEATEPTVSGFTNIGTLNGGGGSQGAGTGNRRLTFFTRELLTADDTTPAIDLATGNVMIAAITIFRKPAGFTWSAAVSAFGAETTAGTSWSEAMTTDPGFSVGDWLVAACAVRDTSTTSAEGFSATGATFSALDERIDLASETGNDISLHVSTASVLTGPSSAAGTRTATHSTSESGVMGVLRVRSTNAGNGNVAAVTATSSAAGVIPVVAGTQNPTVAGVAAGATAAAPAPVVGVSSSVAATLALATALALAPVVYGESVVSGGGPASASAQAIAPVVAGVQNPTVVGVAATATAAGIAPVVSGAGTANVDAIAATATSSAPAPAVAGQQNPTVAGVAAGATAAAVAPSVSGGANVTAVAGGATALAPPPAVDGTTEGGANVVGVAATATASANIPAVSGAANITSTTATATTAAPAPTITGGATVTATPATATGLAAAPSIAGVQNSNVAAIVAGAVAAASSPAVLGLTGTPVAPASRTYAVAAQYRVTHVAAQSRVTIVPAESRTTEVS